MSEPAAGRPPLGTPRVPFVSTVRAAPRRGPGSTRPTGARTSVPSGSSRASSSSRRKDTPRRLGGRTRSSRRRSSTKDAPPRLGQRAASRSLPRSSERGRPRDRAPRAPSSRLGHPPPRVAESAEKRRTAPLRALRSWPLRRPSASRPRSGLPASATPTRGRLPHGGVSSNASPLPPSRSRPHTATEGAHQRTRRIRGAGRALEGSLGASGGEPDVVFVFPGLAVKSSGMERESRRARLPRPRSGSATPRSARRRGGGDGSPPPRDGRAAPPPRAQRVDVVQPALFMMQVTSPRCGARAGGSSRPPWSGTTCGGDRRGARRRGALARRRDRGRLCREPPRARAGSGKGGMASSGSGRGRSPRSGATPASWR